MTEYSNQNQSQWNRLAKAGSLFARVATDEECRQPLRTLDSRGWLPGSVVGKKVLCLAAGGGWQSILYAVAGAQVTVLDLSPEMLALDREQAEHRNVKVKDICASMTDLSQFAEAEFDIVHQPVSTCYIPDLNLVYREIARVLKPQGLYISQHKQPTSLQITDRDARDRYVVGLEYYQKGSLPVVHDESYREAGTVEFLHRWEQLIGGLCRCGFVIEDLVEPCRADWNAPAGDFRHRGRFIAPYLRIKARRTEATVPENEVVSLWTPG